jgi:uncharacterized protein DUF922
MEFLERQAETRHEDHAHVDAPALHKPEPLEEAGDSEHQPDCTFKLTALPKVQCGCCAVMPKVSVTGTPPADSSSGDKPADSSGGTDASSSGSSGSTGGTDTGGGASAAGTGGTGGDTAKPQDDGKDKDAKKGPPGPGKVKITFTPGAGPAIDVPGDTYRKMYAEVDSRAELKKEGGKVTPESGPAGTIVWAAGVHDKTPKDEQYFKEVPLTITLKVSLPQWTGKGGGVTADDNNKWKKWADGVKAHEDKHIAAFKQVKEVTVDSAKVDDIDAAVEAAWTTNNAAQTAVDGTPPPPLDAPGGTTKIGPDGKETPVSTDGKQASAEGDANKQKEGESSPGAAHTPAGGGGNQPSPSPNAQA